jgi:SAM-dependent methyltransferase
MTVEQKLPQLQELKDYLKDFDFFERYVRGQWEGDLYVETHARRFLETLRFMPALPKDARVLELGAVPYYMTILLMRYKGLRVDPVSFYEVEQQDAATHTVENAKHGQRFDFDYRAVNVERDLFPYPNGQYELVLCCEILEHLLINPSHMLYEIHRVLKPGGFLLVTTPNVLRWGNLFSILKGRNIYDRYHGNGIYGRHNREYSADEVADLLEANAFAIERLETRNIYGSESLNSLRLFPDRRDNIFALARTVSAPRTFFPEHLYALMDQYRNVVRSALVMGANEAGQLGRGWHGFETAAHGFRWTSREPEFYLKNRGATRLKLQALSHHPKIAQTPVRLTLHVNDREIGTAHMLDHEWHDLSFDLDKSDAEEILRCRLSVSETWIPKLETASDDERELGIGISRIWLE